MRPAYFGLPGRELFGIYEAPAAGASDRGVVLCHPHGRDYAAAFRAFRVLSGRLAAAGLHVLRFDYAGTGDSWGDAEDGSVAQWTEDIVTAIDALHRAHGCGEIALVGLRLGAMLAALAGIECQRAARVVLWEPVVDGREYVADLQARHRAWLAAEARERRRAPALAQDDELLGSRMTAPMRRDLEARSLRALPKAPAPHVALVTQAADPAYDALAQHLRELGSAVAHARVTGATVWNTTPGMEQGLVPSEAIRAIVDAVGARR
ncbi:MAG: alpha/beta fold hydrolase [Candidatus Rokubacteria bacterium]|nr:alpha/beta fold hydrolase [Candidatus Rokubacteria bacterium]